MKLIKKLSPKYINGRCVSLAIFWCDDCKQEVEKRLDHGKSDKSCGCHKIKHGESKIKTRLYTIWIDMKQRILNQRTINYKIYGGRGITICPEWTNDYIKFRDWSLNNGYANNLTIDRINNNGNYEPSNCQWITQKENNQKQSTTKINMGIANEIRTLYNIGNYTQKELAEKYGISREHVSNIVNNKTWKT